MLKKLLLIPTIMITLHANNTIEIQDANRKLNIAQKSKHLGTNSINIGDNNQNITITQKIEVIHSTNNTLLDIKSALKDILPNREKINNYFQKLLSQSKASQQKEIQKLYQKYQALSSQQQLSNEKLRYLKSDIDYLISQNKTEIEKLQERVAHVEKDISFLMSEFKKGNLTALSFYSLHVDGLYLDETFYKGAGIGYERLFNNSLLKEASLISSISFLSGTEENIIQDEDKQLLLFDIGIKKPLSSSAYGQSAIGYMNGDESSLYLKLGVGMEKYNTKNKISLDLNYIGIFEKEQKTIKTHLIGNAEVLEEKKYQSGLSLVLSVSFTGF